MVTINTRVKEMLEDLEKLGTSWLGKYKKKENQGTMPKLLHKTRRNVKNLCTLKSAIHPSPSGRQDLDY